MLLRFSAQNLFSFQHQVEFNTLPGQVKRLAHHKYQLGETGLEVLKLSAIYGANGAGKSNLVKAVRALKTALEKKSVMPWLSSNYFKLDPLSAEKPVEVSIEFFTGGKCYYYQISVLNGKISEEQFLRINTTSDDEIIFHRVLTDNKTTIKYATAFEQSHEFLTLTNIIEQSLLKQQTPLLSLLVDINNEHFTEAQYGHHWLMNKLIVLMPETRLSPSVFFRELDENKGFFSFSNRLVSAYGAGITRLLVDEKLVEDTFDKDALAEMQPKIDELKADPDVLYELVGKRNGEQIVLANEKGEIRAKRLLTEHAAVSSDVAPFPLSNESDGTRRLIEYIPMLFEIIHEDTVYIIDEVERSLHPLIIYELIEKFSKDEKTKGQLIFTTHESNLLNQDMLRQDEIWLAEKNGEGASTFYPLSDFKEHHTLDLRKGYLNGRYGAIPFLGNLEQLNWHQEEEA